MTSRRVQVRHIIDGGWATDFGPSSPVGVGNDGIVRVPFLVNADNMVFERNSAVRKAPGSAKVNSSELESGATIVGVYDAWFSGTSGSSTQHRIVNVDDTIKKDDANGTFTNLFTGLSAGAVPTYAMIEDLLIVGLNSTDTPKSWDGSTAQALAGSPPNFSIVEVHRNRVWASGVWAHPSRVYYSPLLDPENTTGEGWGFIDIDPDDGDVVTGLRSHRGELVAFKGPYKGSIHRIQGSSPTGSDGFRRPHAVTRGVTAAAHNVIFHYGNDLGFVTPTGQVQSLAAVERFGDYDAIALSRGLRKFSQRVNFSALNTAWAATNTDDDLVAFALPIDGASTPNFLLVMDYFWNPPRFVAWPKHECTAITSAVDASASNRRTFLSGASDGFVRKLNQTTRAIDDTIGIDMLCTTPFLDYAEPFRTKTLGEGFLEFSPKNGGDIGLSVRRDTQNAQEYAVSQVAGDPLGNVGGTNFTLGISALSASSAVKRFFEYEDGGDFRQVQFEIANDALNEDVEVHSFGASFEVGSVSTENVL